MHVYVSGDSSKMPLQVPSEPGLTLYVLTDDENNTSFPMTEGEGLNAGIYTASDAVIVASGLASGTYMFRFLEGDWENPDASDPRWGFDVARFNGSIIATSEATTISSQFVDRGRTWWFRAPDDLFAANTINELIFSPAFDGLFAMDFSEPLPEGTSIFSVESVSVVPSGPTVGLAELTADRKEVHIPINVSTSDAGTYAVVVVIKTTDTQYIVRQGLLILTAVNGT